MVRFGANDAISAPHTRCTPLAGVIVCSGRHCGCKLASENATNGTASYLGTYALKSDRTTILGA